MKVEMVKKELDSVIKESGFQGVVSLRKDGKVLYENASGYADRANKIANRTDTKFAIASGTKFFTALAIGKLIEEGRLTLDTKALEVITYSFKLYSRDITVEELLTHTSGMPDYFDEDEIEDFDNFKLDIPWFELEKPEDYFPVFPKEEMKSEGGEKFAYNNGGYVLLAAIIAKVSGMSYVDYVSERVLKPIGMIDSGFHMLNKLPENTANGYIVTDDDWKTNVFELPIIGAGDGGLYTTIKDMYLFWDALFSYNILSKELIDLFLNKYVKAESDGENTYYGHGIWIYDATDIPVEEYIIGCDPGISFKSAVVRDSGLIYTVISNTEDGAWPITRKIVNLDL